MRYFGFTITSEDRILYSVGRTIVETSIISRETLVHVNETKQAGVMLYRLQGDSEALKACFDDHPDVISYAPVDVTDESLHLYVHIRPGQPASKLTAIVQKYALMLILPLEFTNGGLRVTIVGIHEMIRAAFWNFLTISTSRSIKSASIRPTAGTCYRYLPNASTRCSRPPSNWDTTISHVGLKPPTKVLLTNSSVRPARSTNTSGRPNQSSPKR